MRVVIMVLVAMLAASCSFEDTLRRLANPQDLALGERAVRALAAGDSARLAAAVAPELRPRLAMLVDPMRRMLPPAPLNLVVADYRSFTGGGQRQTMIGFEARGGGRYALVQVTILTRVSAPPALVGLFVTPLDGPLAAQNAWAKGKAGIAGWLMIAAMVAAVATTIAALVKIWRQPFRRRWLWTLGSLFGVMAVRLNWATGEWAFQPIFVSLFSVSATKQPVYAPWMLTVSLPVVAIVALVILVQPPTADEPDAAAP